MLRLEGFNFLNHRLVVKVNRQFCLRSEGINSKQKAGAWEERGGSPARDQGPGKVPTAIKTLQRSHPQTSR